MIISLMFTQVDKGKKDTKSSRAEQAMLMGIFAMEKAIADREHKEAEKKPDIHDKDDKGSSSQVSLLLS